MAEVNNEIAPELLLRWEKDTQSTRDDVNLLKGGYSVLQRDLATLTSSIDKLVTRFEETRKLNWPMIGLLIAILPLMIAGLAFFTSSYTNSAISPLLSELSQVQANQKAIADQVKEIATTQASRGRDISSLSQTSTTNSELLARVIRDERDNDAKISGSNTADAISRTDRQQLNDRVVKLENSVLSETSDRKEQAAEFRVQLKEVEQQFHSVSNLENLRAAQQQRLNAQLWEKTHPGERYPDSTFFPTSIFQGEGGSAPINGK